MTKYELSDADAAQVRAILLTHAEMTDQEAIHQEQEMGARVKEFPNHDTQSDKEDIDDCIEDSENLKRLADIFK